MICYGCWRERDLLCTDWVGIFKQHSVNKIAWQALFSVRHPNPDPINSNSNPNPNLNPNPNHNYNPRTRGRKIACSRSKYPPWGRKIYWTLRYRQRLAIFSVNIHGNLRQQVTIFRENFHGKQQLTIFRENFDWSLRLTFDRCRSYRDLLQ